MAFYRAAGDRERSLSVLLATLAKEDCSNLCLSYRGRIVSAVIQIDVRVELD